MRITAFLLISLRCVKILFLLLFVYSFAWYFLGLYLKNKIRPILLQAMHVNDFHYESIDLSGYPLSFNYVMNKPKFYIIDDGVETIISLENINIKTSVLLKKINVSFRDDIFIRSDDNKKHYIIKLHDDSDLELLLSKPILISNFFSGNPNIAIKRFSYRDYGYEVLDKNLDKIISVSKWNEFAIDIEETEKGDQEYHVAANLNSGIDVVEYNLNGDIEYSVLKNVTEDSNQSFALKVNRFEINSDNHHLKIAGDLDYNLSTKNSSGTIDVTIGNFDSLIKTCSAFLYTEQVKLLKNVLLKMSGSSEKQKEKDIYFSISGTENGVKYGNIIGFDNVLSLVMEGKPFYSPVVK